MNRRIAATLALIMVVVGLGGAVLWAGSDGRTYDEALAQFFVTARTPTLNTVMSSVTFLGDAWALAPLTLILAVALVWRRRGSAALVLLGAMTASWTLTNLTKSAVGRARPDTADLIGAVSDTGAFPSGHTLNSAVFLAVATGVLIPSIGTRSARIAAIVVAVITAVAIGVSRLYLGYHWLSDVLGGWAMASAIVGAAWLLAIVWARPSRVAVE